MFDLILEVLLVKHVLSELLLEVVTNLLLNRFICDLRGPSYRAIAPRFRPACYFKAPASASAVVRFVVFDF